jgi:hypothetical protein
MCVEMQYYELWGKIKTVSCNSLYLILQPKYVGFLVYCVSRVCVLCFEKKVRVT